MIEKISGFIFLALLFLGIGFSVGFGIGNHGRVGRIGEDIQGAGVLVDAVSVGLVEVSGGIDRGLDGVGRGEDRIDRGLESIRDATEGLDRSRSLVDQGLGILGKIRARAGD